MQKKKNNRKVVYYARCISIDWTPQYDRDVALLESLGWDVLKLTADEKAKGYKEQGMDYFFSKVDECDILAFRAIPSGHITAGMFKEIHRALSNNIPVIELPSSLLRRELSVDQTREYLMEVGKR